MNLELFRLPSEAARWPLPNLVFLGSEEKKKKRKEKRKAPLGLSQVGQSQSMRQCSLTSLKFFSASGRMFYAGYRLA